MQGVTQRNAKAVQKHFEHMVSHSRMHVLFQAFRKRGFLTDIIDSVNICTDFRSRPLPMVLPACHGESLGSDRVDDGARHPVRCPSDIIAGPSFWPKEGQGDS